MATISLPWPDPKLSPNARTHWAVKSRYTRDQRTLARVMAQRTLPPPMVDGKLSLRITFRPPDRRARDLDNMLASCKAYLDGISDAYGVNDARFVLTLERGEPVKGGCVEVWI